MESKVRTTTALQLCGLIAGPLFIFAIVIQALTRSGFDLVKHPASLLSLGDAGAVQIANFMVAGLLMIAFAIGIRRQPYPARGGTWGPWFVGAFGLGLIIAGLFPPDAAFGFPPGTPDGVPSVMSYHSILHGVGFTLSFAALTAACVVFAVRDGARRLWGGVAYTAATALVALVLSQSPGFAAIGLRDLIAAIVAWTWITVLAARLMGQGPAQKEVRS